MQISMTMHGLPWVHAIISSSSSHWKSKARLEYHSVCFKVSTNQTVEYPLSLRTHCPSLHVDQSQTRSHPNWWTIDFHKASWIPKIRVCFWNVSLPTYFTVAVMTFKVQLVETKRQASTAFMPIHMNGRHSLLKEICALENLFWVILLILS